MKPALQEEQVDVQKPVDGDGKKIDYNVTDRFFPAGAIVFFICLMILTLLFWYGIYFLMIKRT